MAKYSKRTVRVTQQHNEECRRLLRLMGVPVIEVRMARLGSSCRPQALPCPYPLRRLLGHVSVACAAGTLRGGGAVCTDVQGGPGASW